MYEVENELTLGIIAGQLNNKLYVLSNGEPSFALTEQEIIGRAFFVLDRYEGKSEVI